MVSRLKRKETANVLLIGSPGNGKNFIIKKEANLNWWYVRDHKMTHQGCDRDSSRGGHPKMAHLYESQDTHSTL